MSRSNVHPGKLPLIFLILLIVCAIITFASDDRVVEAMVNHLGGFAIVGLLACLTAYIAKKKGRNYRNALLLAISLPVLSGAVVALLVFLRTGFIYCGGGVVLVVSLLVIVGYSVMRTRKQYA